MNLIAKVTAAGMTAGKKYNVIKQDGDMFIKNRLVKIILDNGDIGLRLFSTFDIAEED